MRTAGGAPTGRGARDRGGKDGGGGAFKASRPAAGQEVEVAALVRLQHALREQAGVATLGQRPRRLCRKRAAPPGARLP